MKQILVNKYIAFLLIFLVSSGCAWLIYKSASAAEAQAALYSSEINSATGATE
jgi:hypothetical protein